MNNLVKKMPKTVTLTKEIGKPQAENFYVIVASAQNYNKVKIDLMKHMSKYKLNGIYVTLNKPYTTTVNDLKKNKIKFENIFFIDGAGKKDGKTEDSEKCAKVSGPESLTEISLTINAAANTKKFDYLVFDSLSTLLIDNQPRVVEKFVQYVTNRIVNQEMQGYILSLDDEDSMKVVKVISQFCDKTIFLN